MVLIKKVMKKDIIIVKLKIIFEYIYTVRVTARGNANMLYRVWVVNPAGVEGDVGYVRGDGSTIEKNLFLSIAGDYHIYAQPWSGTTNGQSSYFDFNITW